MILNEIRSERYFTLALGFLDLVTGQFQLVQAGHPHPLILRADGHCRHGSGPSPLRNV